MSAHRGSSEEGVASVERELAQERAAALGRATEKVDVALARLEKVEDELRGGETEALIARFNELRAAAERARHDLIIHREALGIRDNSILYHRYPIPPAR